MMPFEDDLGSVAMIVSHDDYAFVSDASDVWPVHTHFPGFAQRPARMTFAMATRGVIVTISTSVVMCAAEMNSAISVTNMQAETTVASIGG